MFCAHELAAIHIRPGERLAVMRGLSCRAKRGPGPALEEIAQFNAGIDQALAESVERQGIGHLAIYGQQMIWFERAGRQR